MCSQRLVTGRSHTKGKPPESDWHVFPLVHIQRRHIRGWKSPTRFLRGRYHKNPLSVFLLATTTLPLKNYTSKGKSTFDVIQKCLAQHGAQKLMWGGPLG